jgi:thiamine transport system ATP-binding protein
MTGLQLTDLHKSFDKTRAVDGVSFEVAQGEIVALLGPSGCGKSTVLALIAGLETPDRGEISWDGASLKDVPPHRRGFGLMFRISPYSRT